MNWRRLASVNLYNDMANLPAWSSYDNRMARDNNKNGNYQSWASVNYYNDMSLIVTVIYMNNDAFSNSFMYDFLETNLWQFTNMNPSI